uniref:Solute carrier family 22 member 4-like n=1 Tax=Labrus bergylta TaxID=56723 RepID=A0A3Q3EXH2_9LABR
MTDYEAATAFIGEWGRFQQEVFFLLCMSIIPNGFTSLSIVFLADTLPHRCLIPAHVNLTAAWRNSSIPLEADSPSGTLVPSKCARYKLQDVLDFSDRGLLPGVDVNLSHVSTEGCLDGWEYDRSVYNSTIISEVWEKKHIIRYHCCPDSGHIPSGLLTILGHVLRHLFHCWIGRNLQLCYCVCTRSRDFRPTCSDSLLYSSVSLFFAVGYMLLPLFAFFIRDWRMLSLGLALPGFFCVPLWWYIPESPRWLLSQGRVEEAEAIIRNAAKRNKIEAPSVIFSPLQIELQSDQRKAYNICDLLRSPNIRWLSITLWLVWNTVAIGYFALSLNTSNLHGNAFFNCFLSALVEIPAYTLSWVMFRWFSRRLSLSSTLFMGGLFLLLIQLVPANQIFLAITLEMMGKFAVTTAFAIVYAYTAELYPTVLRNTALGTCSMVSRVGSIIAPYFIYLRSYSVSLPYILMGSLTALVGLLSLLLPETRGMPLPDTITHMQRFPGCCQKKPNTLTQVEENENPAERKSLVVQ